MNPFDWYPAQGRELLNDRYPSHAALGEFRFSGPRPYGARDDYALILLQVASGLDSCVYCGISFTQSFEGWLSLTHDHIVPVNSGAKLGIPRRFTTDIINRVPACSACNGYDNRYFTPEVNSPWRPGLDQFIERCLRDSGCSAEQVKRVLRRDSDPKHPYFDIWTIYRFVALRDAVFVDRKGKIAIKRAEERRLFEHKPWLLDLPEK